MGSSPVTELDDALVGVARLGLDTAPIIYFVEAHPNYDAPVTAVFQRIATGALTAYTSVISLCEVLIQPFRQGDADLEREYRDLLLHSEHFQILTIDPETATRAADFRARYNLRTPDALQIAAASGAGCQAFLTNDRALQRVTELRVLVLDDLNLQEPSSSPNPL
jgi:predicted nucleic acid-binding protein